jgi:hypothetical protein
VLCRFGLAQDVVSASAGVVEYFEGAVLVDNHRIEHNGAVFPSLNNGSTIRTERGRAELLLTPGAYLRLDENSTVRMISNSLTDTRLELTQGSAIFDNANTKSLGDLVLTADRSDVRFPNQGVYRINLDIEELEVYSGEAEVSHNSKVSKVDPSHLFYLALETETPKFDDGTTDEFYDWAQNRSSVLESQSEAASAEQADADPDPGSTAGVFVVPPVQSVPGCTATPALAYSVDAGTMLPYSSYAQAPFPVIESFLIVAPYRRAGTSRWPVRSGVSYHPHPIDGRWPASTLRPPSRFPMTTVHLPPSATYYHPAFTRPITTVPRPIPPIVRPARPPVTLHTAPPPVVVARPVGRR